MLFQFAGNGAIGETIATPRTFGFDHFIHVMEVLQSRMRERDESSSSELPSPLTGEGRVSLNIFSLQLLSGSFLENILFFAFRTCIRFHL